MNIILRLGDNVQNYQIGEYLIFPSIFYGQWIILLFPVKYFFIHSNLPPMEKKNPCAKNPYHLNQPG